MIEEVKKLREITEALTQNGHLLDQAEEWRYALDAIPECILIVNTHENVKFINKTLMYRLDLHDKSDVYDKEISEVLTGVDIGCLTTFNEVECNIKEIRGWFQCSKSPIYSLSGKLLGYIIVLKDITDIKLAEEALRLSEMRYKTIFEMSPDAMFILKSDGTIVEYNKKAMLTFSGVKRIRGKNILSFFSTAEFGDQPKTLSSMLRYLSEMPTKIIELSSTSTCKHYIVSLNKLNYGGDDLILASVSDLSKTKRFESDFNVLANNIRDTVWEMDLNFNFMFVSTPDARMLGYNVEEFIGTNLKNYTTGEEINRVTSILQESIYNKDNFKAAVFTTILKRKDGVLTEVEIHCKHVMDTKNNIVGFQGIIIEIHANNRCKACNNVDCVLRFEKDRVRDTYSKNKFVYYEYN